MVYKGYLFKQSNFLAALCLVAIFGLLPLGFTQTGILVSYLVLFIFSIRTLLSSKMFFGVLGFLIFVVAQISINLTLERDVSMWQVARSSGYFFIALGTYMLIESNIKITDLFVKYESYILVYLLGLVAIYFISDVRLFASSLPIENSDRLYIFSPMLFFPLFVMALNKGSFNAVFYLVFLALTYQKTIFVSVVIVFFLHLFAQKGGLKKFGINSSLLWLSMLVALIASGFVVAPRFFSFLEVGDLWRWSEIITVYDMVSSDMAKLLFGHGIGIPYRDFVDPLNSDTRLAVNMRYDVHNFYVDVILKLGLVFLVFLLLFMYRLMSPLGSLMRLQIFSFYLVQGLSSPVLFHSLDFVGFMLALALLVNIMRRKI